MIEAEIAEKLRKARRVVVAGRELDVQSARAALRLAARLRGAADLGGEAAARLARLFAEHKTLCVSPAEARARADAALFVGKAGDHALSKALFDEAPFAPGAGSARAHLSIAPEDIGLLRALLKGRPLRGYDGALDALAAQIKSARYGVIVFDAAELNDPHIAQAQALAVERNEENRFAALPLPTGDEAAREVTSWMTGYALRVDFARGYPQWRIRQSAADLLASGACDLSLCIGDDSPCRADIVIGGAMREDIKTACWNDRLGALVGAVRPGYAPTLDRLEALIFKEGAL